MKASDPLYPQMEMNLQLLGVLKNPQCWFGSETIFEGMNEPEIAATETQIKDVLEDIESDMPPYWLADFNF